MSTYIETFINPMRTEMINDNTGDIAGVIVCLKDDDVPCDMPYLVEVDGRFIGKAATHDEAIEMFYNSPFRP